MYTKIRKFFFLRQKKPFLYVSIRLLFASTLVGCANVAIDEEERNTLAGAPSVSMVLYSHAQFEVSGGAGAAISRYLIERHRLPDPATLVIDYFSAGFEAIGRL